MYSETLELNESTTGPSTSGNISEFGSKPKPAYVQSIIILMYTLIIVIAVGGNVMVCYIVLAYQRMRTVTNFFIATLACSDVMMALLCIPFTFISNLVLLYWPFGEIMCPIVTFMQVFAVLLSAFILVTISCDRFAAIIYPLRPRMTRRQAALVIVFVFVAAILASLPTFIKSRIVYMDGFVEGRCLEDWGDTSQSATYSMVLLLLQYFIPLGVLTFTYGKIGYEIWIKKLPGEAEKKRDQRMAESKKKMIKMMIVVVVTYAVCWLPLHALTIAGDQDITVYYRPNMDLVWMCAHWLAMSNSCCNPIIYFWMNPKFRTGLRHTFRFCRCIGREERVYNIVTDSMRASNAYMAYPSHRRDGAAADRTTGHCGQIHVSSSRNVMLVRDDRNSSDV